MEKKPTYKTKGKMSDFTDREDMNYPNRYRGKFYHVLGTNRGFVLAQTGSYTQLMFIQNGRFFTRTWPHSFAERTLLTLAKRLVEDVAQ